MIFLYIGQEYVSKKLPVWFWLAQVRRLLEKNREEDITEIEVAELDAYVVELDQALEQTADDLLALAKHRQQTRANEVHTQTQFRARRKNRPNAPQGETCTGSSDIRSEWQI